LVAEGMQVAVIDRERRDIESVASNDEPGSVTFYEADVTDQEEYSEALDAIMSDFDGISTFVNSVGASNYKQLHETSYEDFREQIDLNLWSGFYGTKRLLPDLLEAPSASVVYISSLNALVGGFSEIPYAASKAGLQSLARGLTADYGRDDVRFNALCVGTIPLDSEFEGRTGDISETYERVSSIYPLGLGDPEDIAAATAFLCSAQSAWISGVTLPIDGGLMATGALPGGDWWEKIRKNDQ
jgi:NAD(P)-dependent dehydrogenase (short-subunit alcohol dehydrogenase family)